MSSYYEHNAERYAARTSQALDRDALDALSARMPARRASDARGVARARILDAGCGAGRDMRYLSSRGLEVEGLDASSGLVEIAARSGAGPVRQGDLLLFSPSRESFDGILANRSLVHFTAEECRRALATFFLALKPGGHLLVMIDEGQGTVEDRLDDPEGPARFFHLHRADDFASLIRQHGFRLLLQGRNLHQPTRIGFLAQRI